MTALLLLVSAAAPSMAMSIDPPERVAIYLSLTDRYKSGEFALVGRLERLFEPMKALEVERRSSAELRDCSESLRCLVKSLQSATPPVRFVVLISMSEVAGGALTSVLLLDVGRGAEIVASKRSDAEVEMALAQLLRPEQSRPIVAPDFKSVFSHLDRTFASPYFDPVRAHVGDFGIIEVRLPKPELDIAVDGRRLGTATERVVRLERVRPGKRAVEVSTPGGKRFEHLANVQSGTVTTLEVRPAAFDDGSPSMLYIGAGAGALAGVAMLVAHAVRSASNQGGVCFVTTFDGRCDEVTSTGMPRIVQEKPSAPLVRLFPLGYSLVGASLVTAGGAWWLDSEEDWWWSPLIGFAAGVVSYSLSVALD